MIIVILITLNIKNPKCQIITDLGVCKQYLGGLILGIIQNTQLNSIIP